MSRRLQIFLYGGFSVVALLVCAVLTFPYDVLGRRLEAEAAKAMPDTSLVIGEIGPALPLGLRVARVTLHRGTGPENRIELERVRVKPSLWRLLTLKPALNVDMRAFSGEAAGTLVASKSGNSVDLRFENLHLQEIALLKGATGLDLAGALNGRVQLSLDPTGLPTQGHLEATLDSAMIKSGSVMGFTIPAIDLGSPEIDIPIVDGQATIEKLSVASPDAALDVTGSVALKPNLAQSLVKGKVSLRLEDAFLNKNPTIKGVMGFAGPLRKPDGSLEIALDGPLSRPARIPGLGGFGR